MIGVRVRPSRLGRSFVQTRCDPQITTGSSGTAASAAIRAAPDLNSFSSKDRLIVASGNTPTSSPPASAPTAFAYDAAPSDRSTGMCRIPRSSGPATGCANTSCLAMNRTTRFTSSAAYPA